MSLTASIEVLSDAMDRLERFTAGLNSLTPGTQAVAVDGNRFDLRKEFAEQRGG